MKKIIMVVVLMVMVLMCAGCSTNSIQNWEEIERSWGESYQNLPTLVKEYYRNDCYPTFAKLGANHDGIKTVCVNILSAPNTDKYWNVVTIFNDGVVGYNNIDCYSYKIIESGITRQISDQSFRGLLPSHFFNSAKSHVL